MLPDFTEPPYRIRTDSAISWPYFSASLARIAPQTSCASAGVATRPVPMAHTGSYATTTFDTWSVFSPSGPRSAGRWCARRALPASRTSSFSPMHRIGEMPCLSAALTLVLTSSSVSAWYSRRSEWPTVTYEQPSFASIGADISPV